MATAPDLMLAEDEPPAQDGLTLADILSGQNLAEMLEENDLNKIGQDVIRDVEIDKSSRGDWEKRYERNIELAMQVKKEKAFPWPGAANSRSPILTIAAIQFNAEAYPVIVDGSNLVKGKVMGPDQDGTKQARAERVGQHMTWQLLYKMPGWEEETDKLLLVLPILGCMFRKTWWDSVENCNRSEIVWGQDFIIHNDAKSIDSAPRYTQVLHYYPYEVKSFISAGLWIEVPTDDEDKGEDEQALGEYYEQHRCIDLDQDGYPEHYVVTSTKEGKIARIAPCFGPEGITVSIMDERGKSNGSAKLEDVVEIASQAPQAWERVGPIIKIDRRQYFTKYGFIPAPDGSFYDIGFGDLLENTTDLIDTLQNQMLDAASLQNAGGGFIGSGINVRGGNFKFRLGEWKRIDATGGPLRDNVLPLPAPGPSAVSFSLLEMLMSAAKDITSSQDVVAGRAPPNQPATTTLALIEQASTVKKGIFKRIWRAFGQELRILQRLNRDYLDEEEYFQLSEPEQDESGQMVTIAKVGREDYEDTDLDVIPVADPNQVSDAHRMAKAQAAFQMFNGDPLINQKLLREDMLRAIGLPDTKRYFEVPPPAPDPKLVLEALKEARAKIETLAKIRSLDAKAALDALKAGEIAYSLGLMEDAASLAEAAITLGATIDDAALDGQSGVPAMEGPPGDAGIYGLPPPEEAGLDGGMGGGEAPGPGASGAGGFAGPIEQPVV